MDGHRFQILHAAWSWRLLYRLTRSRALIGPAGLVNSIAHAPDGMQHNNDKIKPIMEDAIVLAKKHGLSLAGANWKYIRPHAPGTGPEAPSRSNPWYSSRSM